MYIVYIFIRNQLFSKVIGSENTKENALILDKNNFQKIIASWTYFYKI